MRYQHDPYLVALAIGICMLTAWMTWYVYETSVRSVGLQRLAWTLQTAMVAGTGIWATHFIAMLAFKSPIPTYYDPLGTAFSLLVAVVMTGIGFWVADGKAGGARIIAAGVIIGTGIAMMHFRGMQAMSIAGHIQWDAALAAAALVMGVGFATAACWAFAKYHSKLAAAGLFVLAICTLHFTAMGAAVIDYDPTLAGGGLQTDHTLLATAIAVATMLATFSGLSAAVTNAQIARESGERISYLRHLADHDHLTGLPNRGFIRRLMEDFIEASRESRESFLLLFIDLDGFKGVNDAHGHLAGDHVLRLSADRMRAAVDDRGIVARAGGDEFLIVCKGASTASAEAIAEALIIAFEQPIETPSGETVRVGLSIGTAFYPEDGACIDSIMQSADSALYQVKHSGGSRETDRRSALAPALPRGRALQLSAKAS
ncbi:MAG: MHYT domain-containing protein [Methyloligella sp. ZOD6]